MMVTKIGVMVAVVVLLSGVGTTMIVKPGHGHGQVKLDASVGIVKPGHNN